MQKDSLSQYQLLSLNYTVISKMLIIYDVKSDFFVKK